MIKKHLVIQNKSGLHARPATQLMTVSQKYDSDIIIVAGTKQINPKSIISILSGGMVKGTSIILKVEGTDEEEAVEAIETLINQLEE